MNHYKDMYPASIVKLNKHEETKTFFQKSWSLISLCVSGTTTALNLLEPLSSQISSYN